MKHHAYGCAALAMFCLGAVPFAQAELKPITDQTMGEVTGQAFMQVENLADGTHEFTRMTLGMDVETRVNIDDVKVGEINGGADFAASHVALGHIARANEGAQYNGQIYAEGETVPFEATQPYIELAEDASGLAGFRMGFGQARGSVSSLTSSFSGQIGLKLEVKEGDYPDPDLAPGLYDAVLFGADDLASRHRATQIGIPDDPSNPTTCRVCASLNKVQSLIVGEAPETGTVTEFTDGFFIGFQRDENGVAWKSPVGPNAIQAGKGVFINLPTSMTVNMTQLTGPDGLPRLRTHQADMGPKLF